MENGKKLHHTRGLYPSGDFKDNQVLDEHLTEHIKYNLTWRPGRALFVDGKCFYRGIGVRDKCIEEMEASLAATPYPLTRCTAPYQ